MPDPFNVGAAAKGAHQLASIAKIIAGLRKVQAANTTGMNQAPSGNNGGGGGSGGGGGGGAAPVSTLASLPQTPELAALIKSGMIKEGMPPEQALAILQVQGMLTGLPIDINALKAQIQADYARLTGGILNSGQEWMSQIMGQNAPPGITYSNGQWMDAQGNVLGTAPTEDSGFIPTAGAQYANGKWTDAQGNVIGTAAEEDSAFTPALTAEQTLYRQDPMFNDYSGMLAEQQSTANTNQATDLAWFDKQQQAMTDYYNSLQLGIAQGTIAGPAAGGGGGGGGGRRRGGRGGGGGGGSGYGEHPFGFQDVATEIQSTEQDKNVAKESFEEDFPGFYATVAGAFTDPDERQYAIDLLEGVTSPQELAANLVGAENEIAAQQQVYDEIDEENLAWGAMAPSQFEEERNAYLARTGQKLGDNPKTPEVEFMIPDPESTLPPVNQRQPITPAELARNQLMYDPTTGQGLLATAYDPGTMGYGEVSPTEVSGLISNMSYLKKLAEQRSGANQGAVGNIVNAVTNAAQEEPGPLPDPAVNSQGGVYTLPDWGAYDEPITEPGGLPTIGGGPGDWQLSMPVNPEALPGAQVNRSVNRPDIQTLLKIMGQLPQESRDSELGNVPTISSGQYTGQVSAPFNPGPVTYPGDHVDNLNMDIGGMLSQIIGGNQPSQTSPPATGDIGSALVSMLGGGGGGSGTGIGGGSGSIFSPYGMGAVIQPESMVQQLADTAAQQFNTEQEEPEQDTSSIVNALLAASRQQPQPEEEGEEGPIAREWRDLIEESGGWDAEEATSQYTPEQWQTAWNADPTENGVLREDALRAMQLASQRLRGVDFMKYGVDQNAEGEEFFERNYNPEGNEYYQQPADEEEQAILGSNAYVANRMRELARPFNSLWGMVNTGNTQQHTVTETDQIRQKTKAYDALLAASNLTNLPNPDENAGNPQAFNIIPTPPVEEAPFGTYDPEIPETTLDDEGNPLEVEDLIEMGGGPGMAGGGRLNPRGALGPLNNVLTNFKSGMENSALHGAGQMDLINNAIQAQNAKRIAQTARNVSSGPKVSSRQRNQISDVVKGLSGVRKLANVLKGFK